MDQDGHMEPMATDSKGRIIYAKPTSKPSSTAKTSSNKSNTSTNKSSIAIVVSSGGGGSKHEIVYIPDPRQYYEIQNILINAATTEDAFSQIKNILFKEKTLLLKV